MLRVAAIFRAAVGQHAAELHLVSIIEGADAIVDQGSGGDWRLAIVELGEGHFGVGVDEGLLVNASPASGHRSSP
jgi:hypothetical protein